MPSKNDVLSSSRFCYGSGLMLSFRKIYFGYSGLKFAQQLTKKALVSIQSYDNNAFVYNSGIGGMMIVCSVVGLM